MNTTHTPGPWIASVYVEDEHEVPHFQIERDLRTTNGLIRENLPLIAKSCFGSEPEMLANACLIASAPELLAALETIVRHVYPTITGGDWAMIHAAIAKAKGEA